MKVLPVAPIIQFVDEAGAPIAESIIGSGPLGWAIAGAVVVGTILNVISVGIVVGAVVIGKKITEKVVKKKIERRRKRERKRARGKGWGADPRQDKTRPLLPVTLFLKGGTEGEKLLIDRGRKRKQEEFRRLRGGDPRFSPPTLYLKGGTDAEKLRIDKRKQRVGKKTVPYTPYTPVKPPSGWEPNFDPGDLNVCPKPGISLGGAGQPPDRPERSDGIDKTTPVVPVIHDRNDEDEAIGIIMEFLGGAGGARTGLGASEDAINMVINFFRTHDTDIPYIEDQRRMDFYGLRIRSQGISITPAPPVMDPGATIDLERIRSVTQIIEDSVRITGQSSYGPLANPYAEVLRKRGFYDVRPAPVKEIGPLSMKIIKPVPSSEQLRTTGEQVNIPPPILTPSMSNARIQDIEIQLPPEYSDTGDPYIMTISQPSRLIKEGRKVTKPSRKIKEEVVRLGAFPEEKDLTKKEKQQEQDRITREKTRTRRKKEQAKQLSQKEAKENLKKLKETQEKQYLKKQKELEKEKLLEKSPKEKKKILEGIKKVLTRIKGRKRGRKLGGQKQTVSNLLNKFVTVEPVTVPLLLSDPGGLFGVDFDKDLEDFQKEFAGEIEKFDKKLISSEKSRIKSLRKKRQRKKQKEKSQPKKKKVLEGIKRVITRIKGRKRGRKLGGQNLFSSLLRAKPEVLVAPPMLPVQPVAPVFTQVEQHIKEEELFIQEKPRVPRKVVPTPTVDPVVPTKAVGTLSYFTGKDWEPERYGKQEFVVEDISESTKGVPKKKRKRPVKRLITRVVKRIERLLMRGASLRKATVFKPLVKMPRYEQRLLKEKYKRQERDVQEIIRFQNEYIKEQHEKSRKQREAREALPWEEREKQRKLAVAKEDEEYQEIKKKLFKDWEERGQKKKPAKKYTTERLLFGPDALTQEQMEEVKESLFEKHIKEEELVIEEKPREPKKKVATKKPKEKLVTKEETVKYFEEQLATLRKKGAKEDAEYKAIYTKLENLHRTMGRLGRGRGFDLERYREEELSLNVEGYKLLKKLRKTSKDIGTTEDLMEALDELYVERQEKITSEQVVMDLPEVLIPKLIISPERTALSEFITPELITPKKKRKRLLKKLTRKVVGIVSTVGFNVYERLLGLDVLAGRKLKPKDKRLSELYAHYEDLGDLVPDVVSEDVPTVMEGFDIEGELLSGGINLEAFDVTAGIVSSPPVRWIKEGRKVTKPLVKIKEEVVRSKALPEPLVRMTKQEQMEELVRSLGKKPVIKKKPKPVIQKKPKPLKKIPSPSVLIEEDIPEDIPIEGMEQKITPKKELDPVYISEYVRTGISEIIVPKEVVSEVVTPKKKVVTPKKKVAKPKKKVGRRKTFHPVLTGKSIAQKTVPHLIRKTKTEFDSRWKKGQKELNRKIKKKVEEIKGFQENIEEKVEYRAEQDVHVKTGMERVQKLQSELEDEQSRLKKLNFSLKRANKKIQNIKAVLHSIQAIKVAGEVAKGIIDPLEVEKKGTLEQFAKDTLKTVKAGSYLVHEKLSSAIKLKNILIKAEEILTGEKYVDPDSDYVKRLKALKKFHENLKEGYLEKRKVLVEDLNKTEYFLGLKAARAEFTLNTEKIKQNLKLQKKSKEDLDPAVELSKLKKKFFDDQAAALHTDLMRKGKVLQNKVNKLKEDLKSTSEKLSKTSGEAELKKKALTGKKATVFQKLKLKNLAAKEKKLSTKKTDLRRKLAEAKSIVDLFRKEAKRTDTAFVKSTEKRSKGLETTIELYKKTSAVRAKALDAQAKKDRINELALQQKKIKAVIKKGKKAGVKAAKGKVVPDIIKTKPVVKKKKKLEKIKKTKLKLVFKKAVKEEKKKEKEEKKETKEYIKRKTKQAAAKKKELKEAEKKLNQEAKKLKEQKKAEDQDVKDLVKEFQQEEAEKQKKLQKKKKKKAAEKKKDAAAMKDYAAEQKKKFSKKKKKAKHIKEEEIVIEEKPKKVKKGKKIKGLLKVLKALVTTPVVKEEEEDFPLEYSLPPVPVAQPVTDPVAQPVVAEGPKVYKGFYGKLKKADESITKSLNSVARFVSAKLKIKLPNVKQVKLVAGVGVPIAIGGIATVGAMAGTTYLTYKLLKVLSSGWPDIFPKPKPKPDPKPDPGPGPDPDPGPGPGPDPDPDPDPWPPDPDPDPDPGPDPDPDPDPDPWRPPDDDDKDKDDDDDDDDEHPDPDPWRPEPDPIIPRFTVGRRSYPADEFGFSPTEFISEANAKMVKGGS